MTVPPTFTALLAARFATASGMVLYLVVIAWLAVEQTGSSLHNGLLMGVFLIPGILVTLFGGAYIDTHSRRRIVQVTYGIRAVAFVAIPALELVDLTPLWTLYVLAAIVGTCFAMDQPASGALLAEIASKLAIGHGRANGLWQTASQMGAATGALGGAALLAITTPRQALWAAAAMHLVAVSLLAAVPAYRRTREASPPQRPAVLTSLGETWAFLRSRRILFTVALTTALPLAFLQAYNVLAAPYVRNELAGEASSYALFSAAGALGSFLAAIACTRFGHVSSRIGSHITAHLGLAAFIGLLTIVSRFEQAVMVTLFLTCFLTFGNIVHPAYVQENTPNEHMGRTLGFVQFAASGFALVFAVGAGLLGHVFPLPAVLGLWACAFVISASLLAFAAYSTRPKPLAVPVPAQGT